MVLAIIIVYGPAIWAGYLGGGQFIRTQMRAMRMSEAIRCALLVATIGLLIPMAAGLLAGAVKNGSAHLDRTIAVFQQIISTTSDWIIPYLAVIATNAAFLLIGILLRNRRARR